MKKIAKTKKQIKEEQKYWFDVFWSKYDESKMKMSFKLDIKMHQNKPIYFQPQSIKKLCDIIDYYNSNYDLQNTILRLDGIVGTTCMIINKDNNDIFERLFFGRKKSKWIPIERYAINNDDVIWNQKMERR